MSAALYNHAFCFFIHAQHLLADDPPKEGSLEIFDTWILFKRKKPEVSKFVSRDAQNFLEIFQQSNIDEMIPNLWNPIIKEDHVDSRASSASGPDRVEDPFDPKAFHLALEQNADQLEILNKLHSGPCVVVRGPPGTGKTHTIGKMRIACVQLLFS